MPADDTHHPVLPAFSVFTGVFLSLVLLEAAVSWLIGRRIGLDVFAMVAACVWAGRAFAHKHGRIPVGAERWKLTFGSLAFVYVFSLIAFVAIASLMGFPLTYWGRHLELASHEVRALLWFFLIGLGLNGLLVWVSYGLLLRLALWVEARYRSRSTTSRQDGGKGSGQ
ncbi:MAG: hypothetical protein RLZ98_1883 [Pseudomonadota bacterium]|jgi:hypothetical protein